MSPAQFYNFSQDSIIFKIHCPILNVFPKISQHLLSFFPFILLTYSVPFVFSTVSHTDIIEPNDAHLTSLTVKYLIMIVQSNITSANSIYFEFNPVLKLLLFQKALVLLLMSAFALKLNVSKHGAALHMPNSEKLFVLNLITNVAGLTVLITLYTTCYRIQMCNSSPYR